MTAEAPQLDWWVVTSDRDFIIGVTSQISGMGSGWRRVLDLAHDAADRPHVTTSSDLLLLECREMADLLVRIVQEDGHTRSLAECLRAMVIDAAARERLSQAAGEGQAS